MKKLSKSLVMLLAAVVLLAGCKKQSSEKKILQFSFASPTVEATITEEAKTIVATVPFGTDVTALVPVIVVSEKATVNPASGLPQDFTNPVTYTVTAEDGSQAAYIVAVTVSPFGGGGGGSTDPTQIAGNIDANTTWPDLGLPVDYIIDGYCYIEGNALLTIEPGVTIMFTGSNGSLIVEQNAGLRMVGTADKHIQLVNAINNPNHGAWRKVQIYSSRADNQFEYVDFINGGSDENVISVEGDAKLSIKNCVIDGSLGDGLYLEGSLTAFENNIIKNCERYPIEVRDGLHINQLGTGNRYESNTKNMIRCNFYWLDNETVHSFTFSNQGIPYFMESGMNVDDNSIMVVNAGCEFVFPYDSQLYIGDGCLIQVNGTASEFVTFRGEEMETGQWRGVKIHTDRTTSGGSYLKNSIINGAGIDEDGCLHLEDDTRLVIENLTVSNSGSYGLNIDIPMEWNEITEEYEYDFADYHVTATGLIFSNCALGNIWERNMGIVFNAWPN